MDPLCDFILLVIWSLLLKFFIFEPLSFLNYLLETVRAEFYSLFELEDFGKTLILNCYLC